MILHRYQSQEILCQIQEIHLVIQESCFQFQGMQVQVTLRRSQGRRFQSQEKEYQMNPVWILHLQE